MAELEITTIKADAERRIRAWVDTQIAQFENGFARTGLAYLTEEEASAMGPEMAEETDQFLRLVARTDHAQTMRPAISAILAGRHAQARQTLGPAITAACAEAGIEAAALDGAAGPLIERVLLRGFATYLDERLALESGAIQPLCRAPLAERVEPVTAPEAAFFAHWDEFVADKLKVGDWKKDMPANARPARKTFEALVGDPPPSTLTRESVSKYRAALLALPRDYDKSKRWRDLSLARIAAAAEKFRAENPGKDIALLSTTTLNKHLTNLGTYWGWCQSNGRIPDDLKNPFPALKPKRARGRKARDERPQWPPELERALFASPVWQGCRSIHRRSVSGPHIYRDALFWLPLLGRTMGARSDELCSRKVGDIQFAGDIAYLQIRDSKTESSNREVPLPQSILDFGFLEYRFYGRDKGELLFPELIPQGAGDRHSEAFSNRFTHYRQKIGAYEKLIDFHSFRHNLTTDLANVPGVNQTWVDEITGHASKERASESTRYTKAIYLTNLKRALDHVSLAEALSHLRYSGERGTAAPGAHEQIRRYRDLAEQEMQKKEFRKR